MSNYNHSLENKEQEAINESWRSAVIKLGVLVKRHQVFATEFNHIFCLVPINARAKTIWEACQMFNRKIPPKAYWQLDKEIKEQLELLLNSSYKEEL